MCAQLRGTAMTYVRDGAEIYRQSFTIIRAEADLERFSDAIEERVAVRMIHACGQVDLTDDIDFSPGFAAAATGALRAGAPVLCDTNMVASGVTRSRLPADNAVICTLTDPRVPELASQLRNTRSAAAIELWPLAGALVVIGNAPTALFHLLDLIAAGSVPAPAAVIGRTGRFRRRGGVQDRIGRVPTSST